MTMGYVIRASRGQRRMFELAISDVSIWTAADADWLLGLIEREGLAMTMVETEVPSKEKTIAKVGRVRRGGGG